MPREQTSRNRPGSGPGLPAGWIQRTGIGFAIPELWHSRCRTVMRAARSRLDRAIGGYARTTGSSRSRLRCPPAASRRSPSRSSSSRTRGTPCPGRRDAAPRSAIPTATASRAPSVIHDGHRDPGDAGPHRLTEPMLKVRSRRHDAFPPCRADGRRAHIPHVAAPRDRGDDTRQGMREGPVMEYRCGYRSLRLEDDARARPVAVDSLVPVDDDRIGDGA